LHFSTQEGIIMIQNLNQVSFQKFGTLLPDRNKGTQLEDGSRKLALDPLQKEFPLYRATADTILHLTGGKSVLSVSNDGESFLHFYFDKPVCIKTDTYFCLFPFKGEASVSLRSSQEPLPSGSRPNGSLRLDRQARVEGIYTFFYQEREQGFIFSGEEHPMPELTYVDQGELHTVADGQDILLKQGEIAFKGPNQWHMDYADMGVAPRYVTITFDLEGVDITPLLNRKFAAPQSAVTLIQHMLREQERMDAYSQDMILSYLSALVLTILRHADAPEAKLKASNSVHSENEIIRRAQQYISGHIREKLSVPLVARMVDVSPSYLTALFHKNLQISPGEYIRRIKLQESKQMIREGNLNFTEIAAALQYSTVHHFSRQFKEKFGITPTEYAKSVR
jgi:AraC-like DNA-binding protein